MWKHWQSPIIFVNFRAQFTAITLILLFSQQTYRHRQPHRTQNVVEKTLPYKSFTKQQHISKACKRNREILEFLQRSCSLLVSKLQFKF